MCRRHRPRIRKATNVTDIVPLTRSRRTHHGDATASLEDMTTVPGTHTHGFADDEYL